MGNFSKNTETNVSDLDIFTVIRKLEEDAQNVLAFMASNGLVANPKKTSLMFLNVKKSINQNDIKVKVGTEYIIPEGEIKSCALVIYVPL